jgi:hypothetical protein
MHIIPFEEEIRVGWPVRYETMESIDEVDVRRST